MPHRHRVICWLLRPKLRRSKLIRCARGSSSKKRSTPSHISGKCGSYRPGSGTPAAAAGVLCLRRRPPPPPAWPSAGAPSGPARRKGPSCSSLVPRRREPSPVQLLIDCSVREVSPRKKPWLGERESARARDANDMTQLGLMHDLIYTMVGWLLCAQGLHTCVNLKY